MAEHVSIICPCFNEEEGIELFYEELTGVLAGLDDTQFTLIFVDDGSTDGTFERLEALAARDERVRPYGLTRNFGHQTALTAGLDVAEGDATIMMDADGQHPPTLIPEMLAAWRGGNDVVSAVRTSTKGASWFKRLSSNAFYFVFNRLSDVQLTPGAADYMLLSQQAYEVLRAMPERRRFLRGLIAWTGFKTAELPYEAPPRRAGRSKYTTWRMIRLALSALFSFTTTPIKLATRIGFLCILFGAAYFAYVLVLYFTDRESLVPGWASVLSTVVIFGGVQLFFIGAIGEYVACIFDEVKSRPQYVMRRVPRTRPADPDRS